jgi:hypothetical protein
MSATTFQIASLRESISDETSPLQVAEFLVGQMLTKPDGALYAQWDDKRNEAIWYYSSDHTAIFRLPEPREPILRQTVRGIFRSVVFRLGNVGAEEQDFIPLCGFYFLERAQDGRLTKRKVMVHADFLPEFSGWIKATFLTVKSEPDGAANGILPFRH